MSKGTEKFKAVIQDYLVKRAESDELFAAQYLKPNKNIEACITYILNTVQRSGCAGFDDDEVFSMAIHYYDEDDIQVGTPVECSVVINHAVELTQDEQNEARQSAIKQLHDEAYTAMKKKPMRSKKVTEDKQLSLF